MTILNKKEGVKVDFQNMRKQGATVEKLITPQEVKKRTAFF